MNKNLLSLRALCMDRAGSFFMSDRARQTTVSGRKTKIAVNRIENRALLFMIPLTA